MVHPLAVLALALVGSFWLHGVTPAAAATMQPGQWRFTQTTQAVGKGQTRTSMRCVTPAEASDPASYFTPLGEGCALVSHTSFGSRISSTLRCSQDNSTSDVTSIITFASPAQLSISTRMTTAAGNRSVTATMSGDGVRVGECPAAPRKRR